MEIFRETPEFGRSLAMRIDPFLDEQTEGHLRLFGGGGEAIVFYDEGNQLALKLLAPPCKAAFGWVLDRDARGRWIIRSGGLAEAVERFAWFEALFDSGLELDQIGSAGDFLVLRQPSSRAVTPMNSRCIGGCMTKAGSPGLRLPISR
jgi:hypothetical protein